jgi:hypothetical protein
MDVVDNLINTKRFVQYTYAEKIDLKRRGRPLPDIVIEAGGISRGRAFKRHFNKEVYTRNDWICGCNKKNALFCFPCLLFGGDKAWTHVGVIDLVHLGAKIKTHENSKKHLYNSMELGLLGSVNIRSQLDSEYWRNIQKHNDNVAKNRYVLSKIINCVKFCGAFELALRGHDKTDTSQNPGIFRGLINFSAELDAALAEHLQTASVFKGTSKEIQNDLLDCMLEVCHEEIIIEINKASCLAIMVDETTDVTARSQLVIIVRYIRDGEPVERFWSYLTPAKCDVETLSSNILNVVDPLLGNSPYKLISQSYDGGAVMSGQNGSVQAKIKHKYPSAYFVHCYAHKLNLVMSKAASANSQVRVFFANLKDIPGFFNNAPQRVEEVLNRLVGRKIPQGGTTRWNFNIRTINVVFENRDSLIDCMEEIEEHFNNETVCGAASAIRRMLEDSVFVFWLTLFNHIMPHVDILFNQLQKRTSDPTEVKTAVDNFEQNITQIRNIIDKIIDEASDICAEPQPRKRKRTNNSRFDQRVAALEVCDTIVTCAKDRFVFKDHLVAASLFFSDHFGHYCTQFPDEKLTTTCLAYSTLNKERLRTELSVIYSRNDCRELSGALPLLKFIIRNNLEETLKETKKLLEIVVTTPMPTSEVERCFSTLKRIKTFLGNTMSEDRLTALSMLSVETKFVSEINNFNEKVIDKFASRKERVDLQKINRYVYVTLYRVSQLRLSSLITFQRIFVKFKMPIF